MAVATPEGLLEIRLFARQALLLKARRASRRSIADLFPADGPLRRELYPKQLEFFRAGADHRERIFLSANRVGKSLAGCYEDSLHLTGLYERYAPWWEGKRFHGPVRAWVWGTSDETIRDTVQEQLVGPVGSWGTGLLPGEQILKIDRAVSPVKDTVDTVYVRHASGGTSTLQFKSYKSGRTAAEGTFRHLIHGDEEMPADIYSECLLRTMDIGQGAGLLLLTFTPMAGLTDTVRAFLPDGQVPTGEQTGSKYVVQATWDDVPHLSEDEKQALLSSIPAYQRDARSRGLPVLGSGVIWAVPESDFVVEPFDIPKHWPRSYALDVGWEKTAALWIAINPDTHAYYAYHEYAKGHYEPSVHAAGIRAPGDWISGVVDPAARGRSQIDGSNLFDMYRDLGLRLTPADHAVEAGLYLVYELLAGGQLFVFNTLKQLLGEMRTYARDERGRVIKIRDHLCDCLRYWCQSGREVARPVPVPKQPRGADVYNGTGTGWML